MKLEYIQTYIQLKSSGPSIEPWYTPSLYRINNLDVETDTIGTEDSCASEIEETKSTSTRSEVAESILEGKNLIAVVSRC